MSCSFPWAEGTVWSDAVVQNHYMYRGTLVGAAATQFVNGTSRFGSPDAIRAELHANPDAGRRWAKLKEWLISKGIPGPNWVSEMVVSYNLEHGPNLPGLVDINREYPDENAWWGSIDLYNKHTDESFDFKCAQKIRKEYWTQQLSLRAMLPGNGPAKLYLVQVTEDGVKLHEREATQEQILTARAQMEHVLHCRHAEPEGLVKVPGPHCSDCPHRSLCDEAYHK